MQIFSLFANVLVGLRKKFLRVGCRPIVIRQLSYRVLQLSTHFITTFWPINKISPKKHPSFSKLNVIKSTREKKPFRLIGSLRVILKNSKNYSRVVKTALLSTKKNQRVSSNYVSSISQRSRWSFQREINLISVQASRTQNICEEDKIRIMRKSIHSFFFI